MTSLIINWIIILVLGVIISRYLELLDVFYSGLISLIIAVVVTYGIHAWIFPAGNLIWALIAVSHASFWSGVFSTIRSK